MRLSDLPADRLADFAHLFEGKWDTEFPEPNGYYVMVLQYVRPDFKVLANGAKLIYAETTKTEDIYQGRVGLVLALGPDAYADQEKYPRGAWVKPGDTVIWPTHETASQRQAYNGLVIAFLPDDRVVARDVNVRQAVEGS